MDLGKLETFLKSQFPNDILIPLKNETKQPLFCHKNNTWSWDKYIDYRKKRKRTPFDAAVILQDLCVIDIDQKETAVQLIEKFPILREVPCEKTKRGFHFWFIRSITADEHGYYDGCKQVFPDIDFKSIHSNHTGGIVVVAPSKDKKWIRTPWETPMISIPDDLLQYIANPTHVPVDYLLLFEDGGQFNIDTNTWIRHMAYFEPFMDESLPFSEIPVPSTLEEFQGLVSYLNLTPQVTYKHPSKEYLQRVICTGDKLGLNKSIFKNVLLRNILPNIDIWNTYNESWTDDAELIHLTKNLSDTLQYKSMKTLENAYSWLFGDLDKSACVESQPVLNSDPQEAIKNSIPDEVLNLLQLYPEKLFLAGGSTLGMVALGVSEGNDYDIWVVGATEKQATKILDEVDSLMMEYKPKIIRTKNAVTYVKDHLTIQIILRLYDNFNQVLTEFDLPPSKIGCYIKKDETLDIVCTSSWLRALQSMSFPIQFNCWSRSSNLRILKYYMKGFDVFVPCKYPDALKPLPVSQRQNVGTSFGISTLFDIEKYIIAKRKMYKSTERLREDEFLYFTRQLKYTSDYESYAKSRGIFRYVLDYIESLFAKKKEEILWVKHPDTLKYPAEPLLSQVFDFEKLYEKMFP
jgi:hypothetical protein